MPNDFAITPAGDFSGPLSGLGDTLATVIQQRKMQAAQQEIQSAMQQGDTNSLMKLSVKYPEFKQQLEKKVEQNTGLEAAQAKDLMMKAYTAPDDATIEQLHANEIHDANQRGIGTQTILQSLQRFHTDPEAWKKQNASTLAFTDPSGFKAITAPAKSEDPAEVQALKFRAKASGLEEGTPEYKAFMAKGGQHVEDSTPFQKDQGALTELENKLSTMKPDDPAYAQTKKRADELSAHLAKENQLSAGNAAATLDGDSLDMAAHQLLMNGAIPSGFARNSANVGAIYKRASEIAKEKGMTGEAAMLNSKSIKSDQTSLSNLTKQADMISAFESTAEKNLDMLVNQSNKVNRSAFPLVNKALLAGEFAVGDPEAAKLMAIVKPFVDEYAKILSGSTGSAGASDSARREAAGIIAPYMSQNQISELAPFIRQELHNRTSSLADQRDIIKSRMAGGEQPKDAAEAKTAIPQGIPDKSTMIGHTPDGKPVWQSPDGKKWVQ